MLMTRKTVRKTLLIFWTDAVLLERLQNTTIRKLTKRPRPTYRPNLTVSKTESVALGELYDKKRLNTTAN